MAERFQMTMKVQRLRRQKDPNDCFGKESATDAGRTRLISFVGFRDKFKHSTSYLKMTDSWQHSAAKKYLYKLIVDGTIPSTMKPMQVFELYCKDRNEFENFQDYSNFGDRLRRLRQKVKRRSDRAELDVACLAHDRDIFPAPTVDTKGNPMWQNSLAQELLREDLEAGKHKEMKPRVLYETRAAYNEFYDLDFFRERIYQEIKAKKHKVYIKEKMKKKKSKTKNQ